MITFIETALPGKLLKPIEEELDGWLYRQLDGVLNAYVAARVSSGIGNSETLFEAKSKLLAESLKHMQKNVLKERVAYHSHRDIDGLLEIALPCVRNVLMFAADLLGHCENSKSPSPVESGELQRVLEQMELTNWVEVYRNDLKQFYRKLGRWNSIDEFLILNIHVERLLWQLGMIPWLTREGVWVGVPLGTDAAALPSYGGKYSG